MQANQQRDPQREPDAQDIALSAAYIGIGVTGHEQSFEVQRLWDNGQVELVSQAVLYAPLFEHLWSALDSTGFVTPGVYAYEVQEPFGRWFADWVLKHEGAAPSTEDAVAAAASITAKFFAGDHAISADLVAVINAVCLKQFGMAANLGEAQLEAVKLQQDNDDAVPGEGEYQSFLFDEATDSGFIIRLEPTVAGDFGKVFKAEEWRNGDIVGNAYGAYPDMVAWTERTTTSHNVWRIENGYLPHPQRCECCADNGVDATAVIIEASSGDCGKTVVMTPICSMHASRWWDGADWDGRHLSRKLQHERAVAGIEAGTVGFYRPDPSGPHSPNIVLGGDGDKVRVYEVRTTDVTTIDRSEWMSVDDMQSDTIEVATGPRYAPEGPMADMRDRVVKERIETLTTALHAKDRVAEILAEISGLSAGRSAPSLGS